MREGINKHRYSPSMLQYAYLRQVHLRKGLFVQGLWVRTFNSRRVESFHGLCGRRKCNNLNSFSLFVRDENQCHQLQPYWRVQRSRGREGSSLQLVTIRGESSRPPENIPDPPVLFPWSEVSKGARHRFCGIARSHGRRRFQGRPCIFGHTESLLA